MDSSAIVHSEMSKLSNETGESEIDISYFIVPQVIQKVESESDESSDHFFTEDLVWPDPENVFPKSSGIKPSVLTAELKHLNVGGMELQPKTMCQAALIVRKRPRPKSLPWNVVIIESDPPIIEADDVEEYLVHDPLFVEFFNAFLALPSFPEAVYFNIESGGFEVVTDGKLKLAQQIKEAVRSQMTKVDIYESVQQHAFSDIPVFPIEDTQGPVEEQIERTFDVMALNKEQGILWVKSNRLPKFLESDFYFQYRLAKVISQASIFNDKGEFVVMKIDYTTKSKTQKKAVEIHPPTQEELIIKEMFVSFGDLKGAAKEAWFTQAKKHLKTEVTFSSMSQRYSSLTAGGDALPSAIPRKKSSVFNSHYFGVYSPGLKGPNDMDPPVYDSSKMKDSGILRDRPFTPRPSDRIHAATPMLRAKLSSDPTADEEMIPAGNVVFVWPKQDQQNISAESELEDQAGRETEFARRMREHQIIDQIYNDSSWEEGGTGNIVLKSVDELGSVIVGAVMKKTVAEMLHVNEDTVLSDPYISGIYPSKDLTCVSVDKLNLCVVMEASENKDSRMSPNASPTDEYNSDGEFPDKQPVHIQWHKSIIKPAEEDSEEESLLDSDEDFEERDEHFRRRKDKWHSLTSLKGIQAFKKFLVGTQGEKYWELWIDIDKGRLICSEEEKQKYILHMRDKFYKKGAQFELSAENKRKLKLENLSHWTPEYLFQVQANVLEPLVLYWAPRYLLSHLIHTSPEKYYLYNELKAATFFHASDPYPNTQELLPLRPKSCCPKNRLGLDFGEMNYNMYMTDTKDLRTAPRVGNRRIYSQDTIKRLAKTPTAKYLRKMEASKTPAVPPRQGIPDLFVNLPPVKKSPAISKSASTKSSKVALSDVSEVLSQNPSSVIPFAQKRELSAGSVTAIPCPYNSLAVLFGSKEGQHSAKIPKNLPPPLVKSGDINGDKCRGIKLVPIKKSDSEDAANYTFFRQDSKETSKSCQMYLSSLTQSQVPTEDAESWECEFLNSKRLEMLLQALHHEQDSGRTFRKFIISSKREDWLNNLDFWEKVQVYRKLFYKDKLDLHLITKHARSIFAQCIVEGAPQSINVSEDIKLFILDHLNPPYEDLFDRAEENALRMLFEAFQLYMQQDVMSYCEVERTLKECRLETRNANILKLQKLGLIKERPLTPDDPMEGYVDPVYDDSVLQRVPEQFKNWNMAKLAQNKLELEYFRQFLIPRFAEIDLKCWMDMEAWRRTAPDDSSLRDQRAIEIKKNYLNKKYFFGPNSPAGKDGQNKVMEVGGGWGKFLEDKPHFNSVLKAQKYVRARLENKHLPFFLLTRDFQERHLIDSSMIPEDEDTYMFNQKRSIALMKMLSEGEEAFETVIDKKDKLFVDLHYWTAGGQVPSSLRASDSDAISSQTSFTRSERSIISTHHVLPPIASEKTLVPSVLTSRASVTPGQTFRQPPKSAQQSVKPKYTTRGVRLPAKEGGMPLKAKERFDKRQSFSRWDILLEKHAKLITPMGLIEHVIKEPSEFSEHFESRWVTAIREIFMLQRALKNPTSCSQFKKFVSLSGGFLENDILFWLEVQKYKKMHKRKRHNDAPMQRKVNAIINCFINSYLPPALQIDIPQEMANDILEHRFEMEPTLFQKAGLTVFRGLLPQWVAFREHHRKIFGVDRIEKTLDRHRAVALSKEQKYREKLAQDREIERQVRMQPLSQAEEHEEHEEGMGKDDAAFHYAEYLAQQGILTEGQILASFMAKETQTVRPRQDSAVCDLGFSKNGDDVASIHNGDLDSDAKRVSSASSQKKSSDVRSAISKLRTGDSRDSPQRAKSVGFVNSTTVK